MIRRTLSKVNPAGKSWLVRPAVDQGQELLSLRLIEAGVLHGADEVSEDGGAGAENGLVRFLRTAGVFQAARNLRKQGVPIDYALAILVGRK